MDLVFGISLTSSLSLQWVYKHCNESALHVTASKWLDKEQTFFMYQRVSRDKPADWRTLLTSGKILCCFFVWILLNNGVTACATSVHLFNIMYLVNVLNNLDLIMWHYNFIINTQSSSVWNKLASGFFCGHKEANDEKKPPNHAFSCALCLSPCAPFIRVHNLIIKDIHWGQIGVTYETPSTHTHTHERD